MLYFLSPSAGRPQGVRWYAWVIGIGINLGAVGALVMWGRRGPAGHGPANGQGSARQAAVLAVAAGTTFGLTAALIKGMTETFSKGLTVLLTSWELYGWPARSPPARPVPSGGRRPCDGRKRRGSGAAGRKPGEPGWTSRGRMVTSRRAGRDSALLPRTTIYKRAVRPGGPARSEITVVSRHNFGRTG
jgi:hypothetical protein